MSQVAAVRAFNRFYTHKIGILDDGLLASRYSLTEVRVLWELANRGEATATELRAALDLDAGYLSRMLALFERRRLVTRQTARGDQRRVLLRLTARGKREFNALDVRSADQIEALLRPLGVDGRRALVASMQKIASLLGDQSTPPSASFSVRGPEAGDLGWIVHRHGVLYAQEYGWDARFEGLVAEIVARFAAVDDAKRQRCFIAERDGAIVGSVLCVGQTRTVAKLRLLLVEPSARGLGIGARLIDECIAFARAAGYRRLELWTNSVLTAARRLYERAGFVLVHEAPHRSFGARLVGQTFRLTL